MSMADHFDTMQVCKRWGHKITEYYDSNPTGREDYCRKCGSATTYTCESCKTNIRGYHHFDGVVGGGRRKVPLNCYKCGAAYPWRSKLLWKQRMLTLVSPLKYLVDSFVGIFKK